MMKSTSILARIRRDTHGVATIEFALWCILIFSVLVVSADFGIYAIYKQRLKRAVSEASIAAFNSRSNVDPVKVAQYVTARAHVGSTPSVSVTCNDGSTCVNIDRSCGCISSATGAFAAHAQCGGACPSGGLSGYYLTIAAEATYHYVVLPNPWLNGTKITARVTVRMQ